MPCSNPFMKGMHAFDCGACIPCRLKRRRTWQHRIMLEAYQHADNAFITLTYSDDNLPSSGTLIPEHLTAWLKRLRKAISPVRVRYYAVGEYGTQSQRPHYHIALFGYPTCFRGSSRLGLKDPMVNGDLKCCSSCDLIWNTWQYGSIYVGALETKSAQYIAGYVMKKMTNMQDSRLNGRWPEFSRMSLKPGIGLNAMHDVADRLLNFNLEMREGDVPVTLSHGKKQLPLGRYLRTNLRKMIGRDEKAPQSALDAQAEKLLPLQILAKQDKENPSLKAQIVKDRQQANASTEAREKILKSKGKI